MTSYAQYERGAICDSFLRLGPDAPTLDEAIAAAKGMIGK